MLKKISLFIMIFTLPLQGMESKKELSAVIYNETIEDHNKKLITGLKNKNKIMIQEALDAGADVDALHFTENGTQAHTALGLLLTENNPDLSILQALLVKKPNLNHTAEYYDYGGGVEICSIRQNYNNDINNIIEHYTNTLLQEAIEKKDVTLIKKALAQGANYTKPLHELAQKTDNKQIIQLISIAQLWIGIQKKDIDIVQEALAAEADIEYPYFIGADTSYTALGLALVTSKNPIIIQAILNKNPKTDKVAIHYDYYFTEYDKYISARDLVHNCGNKDVQELIEKYTYNKQ